MAAISAAVVRISPGGGMTGPKVGQITAEEAERRLCAAEAALDEVRGEFGDWIREALGECRRLQAALAAEGDAAAAERLYAIAHDVKGVSGGVGYALLTRIGDSLCRMMTRASRADTPEALKAIDAHLRAAELIVEKDITGNGGPHGEALIAELAAVAERVAPPDPNGV